MRKIAICLQQYDRSLYIISSLSVDFPHSPPVTPSLSPYIIEQLYSSASDREEQTNKKSIHNKHQTPIDFSSFKCSKYLYYHVTWVNMYTFGLALFHHFQNCF